MIGLEWWSPGESFMLDDAKLSVVGCSYYQIGMWLQGLFGRQVRPGLIKTSLLTGVQLTKKPAAFVKIDQKCIIRLSYFVPIGSLFAMRFSSEGGSIFLTS